MNFRKKLIVGCATAVLLSVGQATSADLPPPPPEPEGDSCLYARVDGGYAWHQQPDITKSVAYAPWGGSTSATDEELDDTYFIEGGIGCNVWSHFRIDGVFGYRAGADMDEAFGGLDGDISTFYGFANVYYDIMTWGRLTPYVGGGVGFAVHNVNNISLPASVAEGQHTSFAWNVQAGLAVDLTSNLALDVGYRYADFGDARSGRDPDTLDIDNITSHDVRVGLRWSFKNW